MPSVHILREAFTPKIKRIKVVFTEQEVFISHYSFSVYLGNVLFNVPIIISSIHNAISYKRWKRFEKVNTIKHCFCFHHNHHPHKA